MIIVATLAHLPAILEINQIINYENPEAFMRESIGSWRVKVFLEQDAVLGYSLYQTIWGNTPFLALVKVFPEHQGKGVGTQLVHEFEKNIKSQWFSSYISSTETSNILSQQFHKKLWFQEIGVLKMEHGDEIFYMKDL